MAQTAIAETPRKQDLLKILVATDCHLGYEENDPTIGLDSFVTFEEILIMAVENEVDMILLGGDLFHDNNPSQQTLNRCMSLLRQYTMGNKPVYLQLLSRDSPIARPEGSAPVNYMDPNLNVSIPVFSIHGNHDDPSGVGLCSAMDTMASAGLINYFGKWTDLSRIEVRPILMQKGNTYLALYGLSHIKDERLSRLFLEEKVIMARPNEDPKKWFNIFVLHQNRVDRGPKRFISDSFLPDFLDLVVWGHEHDCDIQPQKNLDKGFYVTQPGSSVPTSLSEGETKAKHVGLLEIEKRLFRLTPLKLKTTRPFVWEMIRLMDIPVTSSLRERKAEEIRADCEAKVERMIVKAQDLLTGHPKQPKVPLIRLRCDYTDDTQLFNIVKFGQVFYQRVANPDCEVIRLKKIVQPRDRKDLKDAKADLGRLREMNEEEPEAFSTCVESIVQEYFDNTADKKMLILSVKGMAEGVERFIEKGESCAIDLVCAHQSEQTLKKLLRYDVTEDNVDDLLKRIRDERCVKEEETMQSELRQMFETNVRTGQSRRNTEVVLSDDEEREENTSPAPRRGQSEAVNRANSRGGSSVADPIDVDDWEPEPPPTRGRGRGRGSRGGSTRTRAPRARAGRSTKAPLLPPTPSRNLPVRRAAIISQTRSFLNYEDSD